MQNIIETATKIATKIKNAGYEVFFAGGFVRDSILKRPTQDIDIVTNASSKEIESIIPISNSVGKNFEVVFTTLNGINFEISSFRQEGEYVDFRRPNKITTGNIETDALRRDFTINGLYMNPFTKEIIDLVKGREDIKNHTIRAIGNPEQRIHEDRLRILRCFRFASILNFNIEEKTLHYAKTIDILPWVSSERIREEIYKADKSKSLYSFMSLLQKNKIIPKIFPNVKSINLNNRIKSLIEDTALNLCTALKLALIFEQSINAILNLLKFSNLEKEKVQMFAKTLDAINKNSDELSFIKIFNKPWYETPAKLAIARAGETNSKLSKRFSCTLDRNKNNIKDIINKNSPVSGKYLQSLGIPQGPAYKQLINLSWKLKIIDKLSESEIKNKILDIIKTYKK